MRTRPRIIAAVGAASAAAAVAATLAALAPAAGSAATTSAAAHTATPAAASASSLASIQPGGPLKTVGGQPAGDAMAANVVAGKITRTQSNNWAGYAATQGPTKFRYISAHMRVPRVSCRGVRRRHPTYSAHWVGFDGLRNGTVEQDGILVACLRNSHGRIHPVYRAWWEMFPKAPVYPSRMRIHPGDAISMSVSFRRAGHKFRLRVTDSTDHHSFTRTRACRSCKRTSAEIISEAPATITNGVLHVLPLADFHKARFNKVRIINQAGHKAGIVSSRWGARRITQVSNGSNKNWTGGNIPAGRVLDRVTALFRKRSFGALWQKVNR